MPPFCAGGQRLSGWRAHPASVPWPEPFPTKPNGAVRMIGASVRLLGLDFADCDAATAARTLLGRPPTSPFSYVVTPNADHLARLWRSPHLEPAYRSAALRLLDSRVVAGAARMLGLRAPRVCYGSDVAARLVRQMPTGERIT